MIFPSRFEKHSTAFGKKKAKFMFKWCNYPVFIKYFTRINTTPLLPNPLPTDGWLIGGEPPWCRFYCHSWKNRSGRKGIIKLIIIGKGLEAVKSEMFGNPQDIGYKNTIYWRNERSSENERHRERLWLSVIVDHCLWFGCYYPKFNF